jgi:hypothetical protein
MAIEVRSVVKGDTGESVSKPILQVIIRRKEELSTDVEEMIVDTIESCRKTRGSDGKTKLTGVGKNELNMELIKEEMPEQYAALVEVKEWLNGLTDEELKAGYQAAGERIKALLP